MNELEPSLIKQCHLNKRGTWMLGKLYADIMQLHIIITFWQYDLCASLLTWRHTLGEIRNLPINTTTAVWGYCPAFVRKLKTEEFQMTCIQFQRLYNTPIQCPKKIRIKTRFLRLGMNLTLQFTMAVIIFSMLNINSTLQKFRKQGPNSY